MSKRVITTMNIIVKFKYCKLFLVYSYFSITFRLTVLLPLLWMSVWFVLPRYGNFAKEITIVNGNDHKPNYRYWGILELKTCIYNNVILDYSCNGNLLGELYLDNLKLALILNPLIFDILEANHNELDTDVSFKHNTAALHYCRQLGTTK